MKKSLLILSLVGFLVSCRGDKNENEGEFDSKVYEEKADDDPQTAVSDSAYDAQMREYPDGNPGETAGKQNGNDTDSTSTREKPRP